MKLALRFLLPLILYSFIGFSDTSAQSFEKWLTLSDSITRSYEVEKVYLHLDKPTYSSGQDIWFKAYVTNSSNQPSTLSKILYVDLINPSDTIVHTIRLPLAVGLASGDIILPDTLNGGNYRLRAYTQWMRNFGEESFFERDIIITNAFSEDSGSIDNPVEGSASIDLKFFPEGGSLVDSIPSKVAFKAIGPEGIGIDISGYVADSRSARVAEFRSEHAGMGTFMLTPFAGQKYTAVITYKGDEKRIELPASNQTGYVMNIHGEDKINLLVRITASKNLSLDQELKIVTHSSSGIHDVSEFKMARQFMDIRLPKHNLPTGVVQLTLFSPENLPVAERLIFIQHNNQLELDLLPNKQKYGLREKVKMKLEAKNIDAEPVTGSFSVSVTDLSRVPEKLYRHSILSELLLRSELKGYIEAPDYYFTEMNKVKKSHLDNLLLTQGWRRLGWKETLPERSFEPENSISISGKVMLRNSPVEDCKVMLFSPDVNIAMDTLTDKHGRFNFDGLVFADSTKFVLQARTEKEKSNVQIKLDVMPSPAVASRAVNKGVHPTMQEVQLAVMKDGREEIRVPVNQSLLKGTNLLEEIVVSAKKVSRGVKNSSKLGAAEADFVLTSDKIKDHTNIANALYNKVAGVIISGLIPGQPASATLFRNSQAMSGASAMGIFLDGQYMGTDLNIIEPNAVAYIEILRTAAKTTIYGMKGSGGVIIITTKVFAGIEDAPILESPRGIITYRPKGYIITREFYSPDYSVKENKNDIEDLRSTIYWNPEILTGNGKNPEFEFFTTDRPGTYRAIVEGLDYKGRLGRKVLTFTVEEN